MPMPMSDRAKVYVQCSQHIPSVGCSVVVGKGGYMAVEACAFSDNVDLC